jgi:hypothetical protein
VGGKAVYWKYGCWFYDAHSGIQMRIDAAQDAWKHGRPGVVTLEAWGRHPLRWLEACVGALKWMSPIQTPQVEPPSFETFNHAEEPSNEIATADVVVTRQRIGIARLGDESSQIISALTLFRRVGEVFRTEAKTGELALSYIAKRIDEPFTTLRTKMKLVSRFFRRYFKRYEKLEIPGDEEDLEPDMADRKKLFELAHGKRFRIYSLGNRAWELTCQYLDR